MPATACEFDSRPGHSHMDAITFRRWRALTYHDPAEKLRRLRAVERELADVLRDADADVRALRTTELNKYRECRDAALFTYGMGLRHDGKVCFATEATTDHEYDFVTRWFEGDVAHFCPVRPRLAGGPLCRVVVLLGLGAWCGRVVHLRRRPRHAWPVGVRLPDLGLRRGHLQHRHLEQGTSSVKLINVRARLIQ